MPRVRNCIAAATGQIKICGTVNIGNLGKSREAIMPKRDILSAMSTSRQGHFTENAPGGVNRGKDGEGTGLPHACKTSPDIACILLLGSPRQNENIKEWRGVACLRTMAKMKWFYP